MMRASVIYLLFLLQFVAFVPVLLAGKSKDKSVRKRPITRGSSISSNFTNATRSLLDWQNTSLESLRLACNALNVISSGSRAAIARRLFDHYQAHPIDNEVSVASPVVTVSNSASINSTVTSLSHNSISSPVLNTNMQEFLRAELQTFLSRELQDRAVADSPPVIQNHNGAALTTDQTVFGVPPNLISAGSNSFNQQPNSALVRSATPSLPPLPQNVLEQIQSGKFVNFDLLLPATSPLSVEDYTIKVNSAGSEPSVSLVPRAQSRPRVIDFYSWLTAWNYYLQAMSFYHPTRVPELIMYQSIIVRFACQYI